MKLNCYSTEYLAEIIWKRAIEWDTTRSWDSVVDNLNSVLAACQPGKTRDDVEFLIGLAEHRKRAVMLDIAQMTPEQQFRLILDGDYKIPASELIQECFVEEFA
ncbi:hypothetical protein [Thiothrix fructosivorans]|uniref:Uncharacterized protein n=1 Tax=Thiothrix fructosivorans TaxID=111770 RepID=A0A8B0SI97_9GAMM|nr:hypothetical protein [Thiothrix fructosivorans]MBO0611695.1 hypothetical protein [Thiothrix fructosivorans]QTX10645.1 hypothetical protein J1836_019105 [Thiothrix fructosivorans]